jgi:hypothetical protein
MATTKALELAQFGTNLVVDGATGVATQSSLTLSGTTASTSTTTGSLVTLGGAGIAENLYVGGNTVISGDVGAVNATLSGYLRGPASFVIDPAAYGDDTGTVVIAGNLQVDGLTTTINSTTLTVDDKNIVLASGAADSVTADGAGITVDGASASLTYVHSGTNWSFNKPLNVTGTVTAAGVSSTSSITSFIDDNTEYDQTEASELNPVGTDALYIFNTENSSTNGKVSILMRSAGGGGSSAARITLKNSRSGSGALNFLFRDGSDTANMKEKFIFLSSGKMGIGMQDISIGNPQAPLHVGTSSTLVTDSTVRIQAPRYPSIDFISDDTDSNNRNWKISNGYNGYGNFEILSSASAGAGAATSRVAIDKSGNVGIGEDSPGAKLDVLGDIWAKATTSLVGYFEGSHSANARISVKATGHVDNPQVELGIFGVAGTPYTKLQGIAAGFLNTAINPDGGNVGIGTSVPTQKLHVDGATKSKNLYLTNVSNASQSDAFIYWSDGSGTSELTFDANSTADSNIKFNTSEPAGSGRVAMWLQGDDWEDGGQSTTIYGKLKVVDGYGATAGIETTEIRHSIRPSLNLDFANSKELDSRITFYRDSIATYYDSKGTLKYANVNEPRFDHDPATGESKGLLIEEARENSVVNTIPSSFGWALTSGEDIATQAAIAPDGTWSASRLIANNPSSTKHYVYRGSTSGTRTWSVYAKAAEHSRIYFWEGGVTAWAAGYDLISGTVLSSAGSPNPQIQSVGNGWYRCSMTVVVASGNPLFIIGVMPTAQTQYSVNWAGDGGGVLIWGAQDEPGTFATSYIPSIPTFTSRASNATYYDETGILRTAPVNGARYGYSSPYLHQSFNRVGTTIGMRYEEIAPRSAVETGLILELAATNLEDYGILADSSNHGAYLTTGASFVVTTETTAPDGSYTASKLTLVGANDRIDDNYNTFSNGQIYTYSVWLKGPADTAVNVSILTNTGANVEPTIRLTGEWQKVSVTKTYLTTDGGTLVRTHGVIIRGAPGVVTTVTDGSGVAPWASYVYVWGMQVELGAVPTSTIPTYGGTATRAADVASSVAYTREHDDAEFSDISEWYNPSGTLYVDFNMAGDTAGSFGSIVQLVEDTSIRTGLLSTNDSNSLTGLAYRAPDLIYPTIGALTYGTSMKVAKTTPDGTNFITSVNGATAVTTTSSPIVNPTSMYIGKTISDNYNYTGTFSKIAYYPVKLSNAELVALTENN